MWMTWNPTTKEATIFADRDEARVVAREHGLRVLPEDSCTNCGGQKDAEGWCANYCADEALSAYKEDRS